MVVTARWRVSRDRCCAAAASASWRESVIGVQFFEGGDEGVEVVVDSAVVVDESEVAVGFGGGDQSSGLVALVSVDVEERWGGLEVGAGETGVGVRAVLLGCDEDPRGILNCRGAL